jgi:hypothetical protein
MEGSSPCRFRLLISRYLAPKRLAPQGPPLLTQVPLKRRGSRMGSDDCRTAPANGWIVATREAALLRSGERRTTFNTYIVGFDDAAHVTQIPAASRTRHSPISAPMILDCAQAT